MKVYLAVPLVHNRNKMFARKIVKILKELDCTIVSEWITWEDPNPNLDEKGIFKRDADGIKSCDALIADVTEPSIGVGMEIMMASHAGKKIICISKEKQISNFLKGNPNIHLIFYKDIGELREKLIPFFQ